MWKVWRGAEENSMVRITCLLGFHKYKVVMNFGAQERMLWCPRCKKHWAMSDRDQVILEWDNDFTELYESMGYVIPQNVKDKSII